MATASALAAQAPATAVRLAFLELMSPRLDGAAGELLALGCTRVDVVPLFLGMGADGHTASLFPGTRVTRQTSRWVSTPTVAKLNARRMTLTLPVLDAALRVVFLVVGAEKAATAGDDRGMQVQHEDHGRGRGYGEGDFAADFE